MRSSCTRPVGLWKWGALPGEPPHTVGNTPGRKLAGVRVWAGNVTHGGWFLWEWGAAGHCLHSPIVASGDCVGVLARRTFAKVPRRMLQNQAVGEPPVKGWPRHLCRVVMGDPFVGTPFSAAERPCPGRGRLAGPGAVRAQCLAPVYSQ